MMRELGYGAQYRYEPSFAHPVHQEFFPPELQGTRFLSPPPQKVSQDSDCENKVDDNNNDSARDNAVIPSASVLTSLLPARAAVGPGACQRQFQLGSRAVDLDLLEEWEQKHQHGKPWPGRASLEHHIKQAYFSNQ